MNLSTYGELKKREREMGREVEGNAQMGREGLDGRGHWKLADA